MHDDKIQSLPYDKDAEESLIGCALFSGEAAEVLLLTVKPEDFYFDACRWSYQAIANLQRDGRPIDAVTFGEELVSMRKLDVVGGAVGVARLLDIVPHAAHVRHYADIVLERSRRRKLIWAAQSVARKAYEPQADSLALIGELTRQMDDIQGNSVGDIRTIAAVSQSLQERALRPQVVISTGIADVDAALRGGYRPNQLIVVAGRPGMGKTAYALGLLEGAAAQSHPCLMFSLEMDAEEIVERAAADTERLVRMERAPIYFEDQIFDLEGICATIRRSVARNHVRLVVIDYLTLIETTDRNAKVHEKVEKITRQLKRVARQQGVAIVLLSQLNRDLEKRDDKRPKLSDLRSSGAIEQDADIVQFLYRPEVYNSDDRPGEAEIIVAKQRSYRTSTVRVAYRGDQTRFVPFEEREVAVEEYSFDKA